MKISVIGTLNTEVILGPVVSLPEWGGQICLPEQETRYMGSAPSVALPLAKLGAEATVVGTIGDDEAGRSVQKNLREHGLTTDAIELIPKTPTGVCMSLFRADGERLFLSSLGAVGMLNEKTLCGKMWSILSASDLVILTGMFLLPGLGVEGAINCFTKLKEKGVRTALDTGCDTSGWPAENIATVRRLLAVTDVFLPNHEEAKKIGNGESPEEIVRSLTKMGPAEVAMKMGRRGAVAMAKGVFVDDAGFPRDVRDTTAAGEAFNAGYLYGSCKGLPSKKPLQLANAVASLFLQNRTYPNLNEVEELFGSSQTTQTGGQN